jgi:hypothetical protein
MPLIINEKMSQTNHHEVREKLREKLRDKQLQRAGKSCNSDKIDKGKPFTNVEKMALEGDDPQVLVVLQKVLKDPSYATSILQKMKNMKMGSSVVHDSTTQESSDDDEGLPPYVQSK